MTIDKARLTEAKDGWYTIYAVPDDAQVTVSVLDVPLGQEFYIGTSFSLLADNGNANTGGLLLKSAQCVLNSRQELERVLLAERSGIILEDNEAWVGSADYLRTKGSYSFSLNAAEYTGWMMTPLCGAMLTGGGMAGVGGDKEYHGFINGEFYGENQALVSFTVEAAPVFDDVPAGTYYYNAAHWAASQRITSGKTSTIFSPDEQCTNGQILTFLWRAAGEPTAAVSNPFSDVSEADYYYNVARWAYEQDIVSGTEFQPDEACARSRAVTYLWKAAGKPAADSSTSFADVVTGAEYAKAVDWAVEKGIAKGTAASMFSPDSICSRGQIVTFLYRAFA